MSSLLEFGVMVMIISISRVISTGPLFVATVGYGVKESWNAGIKIAYGHTVVAIPLVVLLGFGDNLLVTFPQFRQIISILGAFSLFAFAALQIHGTMKKSTINFTPKYHPFLAGIFLTALNPNFFIWWFTVGFKLISDAMILYSYVGIVVVFVFHMWMDYAWLCGVGFLSGRGKKILSERNYKIFMIILSGALVYFGITFLLSLH